MEEQGKEKAPADLQARIEKLEKSLNNTWLVMDMLILALEQKQVISKADLKEAASEQRSEIIKVHPEFAAGWPDPSYSKLQIHPTKESAEQESRDRIVFFGHGAFITETLKNVSKEFCEEILRRIEMKAELDEINEMIRTLSHFEKTGTLPGFELMHKVALAFAKYVEEYIRSDRGKLCGDPTYILTDSIRCTHRMNVILVNMLGNHYVYPNSHSETSGGAS